LTTEKGLRDGFLGTTEYTDGQPGYMSELDRQDEAKGITQLQTLQTYKDIALEKAKETTDQNYDSDGTTPDESPVNRKARYDENYKRAVLEQGRVEGLIFDKKKTKETHDAAVVAKTADKKVEDDASAAASDKTTAITNDLEVLNKLKIKAAAINDRAQLRVTFYKQYTDEALVAKGKADKLVEETTKAIDDNKNNIKAVDETIKEAIRACKGRGYKEAQAALAAFKQKEDENKIAYDKLKKEYDTLSAPGTGGAAGTRCEYPKPTADGTQEPRPTCAEELCCGAANRFEKNGTKLTIESCQNAKDTTTYTYYPPLPEGAIVQPRTETWRFSCIGGAQQLAVTASAAVAAAALYRSNSCPS